MPNPIHLIPAYNRDYPTEAATLAAWKRGLDFLISDISSPANGAYCSCRDFARNQTVLIRFHKLERFVITNGLKHPNFQTPTFEQDAKVKFLAEASRRNYSADIRAIKLGKLDSDKDDPNAES